MSNQKLEIEQQMEKSWNTVYHAHIYQAGWDSCYVK